MEKLSAPARLFDIVDIQLQKFPKDDMLCLKEKNKWRYYSTREVKETAAKLSAGLSQSDIGFKDNTPEGVDKVVVISNNRPEWIILDLAVQQIGAVIVPVYPTTNPTELNFILQESGAKLVFIDDEEMLDRFDTAISEVTTVQNVYTFSKTRAKHWTELLVDLTPEFSQKVEETKASITSERIATIIYTSGTTGLPKGVMLSHSNIISNLLIDKQDLPFPDAPEYKALSFLPLNHIFERVANYFYMISGVSIYYVTDISRIGDYLKEVKPDVFTTVPRLLEKVFNKIMASGHNLKGIKKKIFFWSIGLAQKYDNVKKPGKLYRLQLRIADKLVYSKWRKALGNNLKFIIAGGAACQERLLRIFHAAKIPVYEGYGPTENSPVISANRRVDNEMRFGTVGVPFGGQKVKLAEDGEICVKGPCVMMGYYKNPELTAETIIDGWLHTGDIGIWVEDKYLKITDRKKEIFKTSGGKYVAPQPIENKLKESALIEQAIVVGEGEKFVGALIVPAFENLKSYMLHKGLTYTTNEDAIKDKDIINAYTKIITKANKNFNKVEQIKKYKLLTAEWGVDTGELSPKLSLRRKIIMDKYKKEIEEIYAS